MSWPAGSPSIRALTVRSVSGSASTYATRWLFLKLSVVDQSIRARDGRSARAHTTAESTDTSPDCRPWLIDGRSAARLIVGLAMPLAAAIPVGADDFSNRRRVKGWWMRMAMRSSKTVGKFRGGSRHQVHESLMTSVLTRSDGRRRCLCVSQGLAQEQSDARAPG